MPKQLVFDDDAHAEAVTALDEIHRAMAHSLGPAGRNAMMKHLNSPVVSTNDGGGIVKAMEMEEPFQNVVVKLVQEAADKTKLEVGDGTTTTILLLDALYRKGWKYVATGYPVRSLVDEMEGAVGKVLSRITDSSRPVSIGEGVRRVATVSSNNDEEIGRLVSEAYEAVGVDGLVTVDDSPTIDTTLAIVPGFPFPSGFLTQAMAIDDPDTAEIQDAMVILLEKELSSGPEMVHLLEMAVKAGKALFIVSDGLTKEALKTVVLNLLQKTLRIICVKAPLHGEMRASTMKDMAAYTGATFITKDMGVDLNHLDESLCGKAGRVISTRDGTTILDGGGTERDVQEQIRSIETELSHSSGDEGDESRTRIGRLTSGIAVIRAGALSETELLEKKARIFDGIRASKAALDGGIVPGGGVTFLRSSEDLGNSRGEKVVVEAVAAITKQIAQNAGVDGPVVANRILEKNVPEYGFDVRTRKYCDLVVEGVIDPAIVLQAALRNSWSMAKMMLRSSVLMTDIPDNKRREIDVPLED